MNDPDLKQFTLTVENVQRVIQATRSMQTAARTDAEFRKEFTSEEPVTASLDRSIKGVEANRPRHAKLIADAGLSVSEYFLTFLALLQADAVNRGDKEARAFSSSVNPENIAFVRRHRAETATAIREIRRLNRIKEEQTSTGR